MINKYAIVNKNIVNGIFPIAFAYREEPSSSEDSGWRFVTSGDTEEFLSDSKNVMAVSLEALEHIEPELKRILELEVGIELKIIYNEDEVEFYDIKTREKLNL